MGGRGGLPKGWSGCPDMCESVIAGKFIAFKTPLDKSFNQSLGKNPRFTPGTVFENMLRKRKRIGLWIDLTNTDRYYHSGIIHKAGIQYFKLKCPGHGTVPTEGEIHQFMYAVRMYIENQPLEDDSYVAVHCTHGMNRTGFFICTFLALYCGFPIRAAIEHFAKCRPPGIYRQVYLDHLLRVHTIMGDSPLPRIIISDPIWVVNGDERRSNGNEAHGHGSVTPTMAPISNENDRQDSEALPKISNGNEGEEPQPQASIKSDFKFVDNPRFFSDNPRIRILGPTEGTLVLREIQSLSSTAENKLPFCEWNELSAENLEILGREEYSVTTFSASATRYLLFIKSPHEAYFVDLYNTVFTVDANFTLPYPLNYNECPTSILLDGNMKWFEGSRRNSYAPFMGFQIDDILAYDGLSVTHLTFSGRRRIIENLILIPRNDAYKNHYLNQRAELSLLLTMTKYYPLPVTPDLLSHDNHATPEPYKMDGILFKPLRLPYQLGPSPNFLKWSATDTARFQLKVISPNVAELLVKESLSPFFRLEFSGDLKDDQIIEAKFNENKEWVFCSLKSDQSSPFSLQHAQRAMKMHSHLRKEYLMEHISTLQIVGSSLPLQPRNYGQC